MENIVSSNSKNKLKYFVMICGCFIAVTAFAMDSPLNPENTKINEFSSTQTNQGLELAKGKSCMTCHQIDTKIVGPAFKEVGRKYASDKTALAKLTAKVLKGSSGTWGPVPMPPNKNKVTEKEAQTIVKWILSLK